MPGTFATNGPIADANASQAQGGLSTGIGVSPLNSGAPAIQTATVADFAAARIGNPTGQLGIQVGTITGGTGYTDGIYTLTNGAGLTGGTGDLNAEVVVTVVGGIITSAVVTKPGRYITAPSVSLATLGGGTDGAIPLSLSATADGEVDALGSTYGTGKGVRYLVAAGAVAVGAAISGGYLNRSTRAMVAGDYAWGVAP